MPAPIPWSFHRVWPARCRNSRPHWPPRNLLSPPYTYIHILYVPSGAPDITASRKGLASRQLSRGSQRPRSESLQVQKALGSGERKQHPVVTPWRKWPPGAREENRKGQAEEEVPRAGLGKGGPSPALLSLPALVGHGERRPV